MSAVVQRSFQDFDDSFYSSIESDFKKNNTTFKYTVKNGSHELTFKKIKDTVDHLDVKLVSHEFVDGLHEDIRRRFKLMTDSESVKGSLLLLNFAGHNKCKAVISGDFTC